MTFTHAILLGIIQGLTEFIPVSSTAHLLLGQQLLGLEANDATFSFLVMVQLGTLVSLLAFYWKDLFAIAKATLDFRNRGSERILAFYVILATVPALIIGFLMKDRVETLFERPMQQAATRLFAAAVLMTMAEAFTKKDRSLISMKWHEALFIGVMQMIAIFPGASRSGTTISAGMFAGFDRPSAARFAFLMSMPVMLAAGAYEMLDVIQMTNTRELLPLLAVGFVTAAIVGWFSIKWLIHYLSHHSLYVFAAYCALLGTIVLILK